MNEFLASIINSFTDLPSHWHQFHFIRPEYFALLIILAALWWLKQKRTDKTQWHQVIPPHLSQVLLNQKQQKIKQNKWLIPLLWFIAVFAVAGPTWQKIEKPVFQVKHASVIVMDMSMSMRATDVKPNRLSKARFKAIDLAKAITDGELALVAYAGDAFTISPLTADNRNIMSLIPSLSPEIMPVQGSYPLSALETAADLLKQAGYMTGDIYWLTDGVDHEDNNDINKFISQHRYKVNIMAFGTAEGAPIKMVDNSLLKDTYGNIVIPKLNASQLAQFSNISSGIFVQSTASDIDITTIVSSQTPPEQKNAQQNKDSNELSLTGDDWQEFGPTLILLLLPFVLLAFRKGVVLSLLIVSPLMFNSEPIMANTQSAPATAQTPTSAEQPLELPTTSWTDFIFSTKDQVAKQAYEQGEFSQAQHTFKNEQWKGSAAYKAGDYETAYQHFKQDNSAQGLYNQGNALAKSNKLDEAIEAYKQALTLDPNHTDAKKNKELLEKLKQQQESQNNESDQNQNSDNSEQSENSQQSNSEQDQSQENGEQQEGQQQNSDQQNGQQQQEQSQPQDSDQRSDNSEQDSQQAPEPTADPNQQESSQQRSAEQQENENSESESESEQSQQMQQEQTNDEINKDEREQQAQVQQLTPEQIAEQENQEKLKQLLRKVSDDPSVLLRNKMILESRKRRQERTTPQGVTKSW